MRKISYRDLPDWFDLNQYSPTKDFDLRNWLTELSMRTVFVHQTEIALELFGRYWETDVEETLADRMAARNSPKRTKGLSDEIYEDTDPVFTPTVNPIDLHFIAWIMMEVSRNATQLTKKIKKSVEALDAEDFSDELAAFLSKAVDDQELEAALGAIIEGDWPIAHAEINLAAPDELILSDMKVWLRATRDRYGLPQKNLFSVAEQAKWHSLRILAYLDLTIWAKVESLSIPYAVMGNALFPNQLDTDIVEKIRRAVKPKAEQLARFQTIEMMEKQVNHPTKISK